MSYIVATLTSMFMYKRIKLGLPKTIILFLIINFLYIQMEDFVLNIISISLVDNFPISILSFSTFLLFLAIAFMYINKERKYIKMWESTVHPRISSSEFSNILLTNCDLENVMYSENIPYNRAVFFSSGSGADIEMDNVFTIFYDAKPAANEMKFQEYGFLVTSLGVIINKQIPLQIKGKENKYDVETSYLPFNGIYRVTSNDDILNVYYSDRTKKSIKLISKEIVFLSNVFQYAIQSGWTYHVDSVLVENNVTEEEFDNRIKDLDSAVEAAQLRNKIDEENKQFTYSSVGGSFGSIEVELSQNQANDRFGGGQGHGHVGEQYGDVYDTLRFNRTEKFGASHEKNGADRAVNGINIQTKYHATAGKSIDGCFYNSKAGGGAKYVNPDGSMMVIEVPKDQYSDAVNRMAKKIQNGSVPGENNPSNAGKYVKKGAVTYEQSQIATKSIFDRKSTIIVRDSNGSTSVRNVTFGEKIIWSAGGDFITGATAAIPFGVASGVWVYCNSVWQGADKKTAIKNSVIAATKPCLIGGVLYMVSSQFAGSQMGRNVGNIYANHFIKKQMTNKAKTLAVQKGTMAIMTVVITVGPDLTDCLRGRISVNQLLKNTVSTGAGLVAGAKIGGLVGSAVPGLGNAIGAIVGGSIGATVARKVIGNFIEDDAVEMISIAKEEFIETVMMSGLSREEFESILNKTFLDKKFSKLLKSMYAADNSRRFIHDYFFELVEGVYMERNLPNEEELINVALIHYERLEVVA